MDDRSDFFQRQAESQVRLPKAIRLVLAVVVLLGAAFFILIAVVLFTADRSKMPSPMGALILALFSVALGSAFAYVGWRLLQIRKQSDHLLSPMGSHVASCCVAAVGAAMMVGGLFVGLKSDFWVDGLVYYFGGLFAFLMAYWLHRSTKRTHREA